MLASCRYDFFSMTQTHKQQVANVSNRERTDCFALLDC